jgi:hypothetical protein
MGNQVRTKGKMTQLVTSEVYVGLTEEQAAALAIATEFSGMKASQYGRQAILLRLVADGFLAHPMSKYQTTNAGQK